MYACFNASFGVMGIQANGIDDISDIGTSFNASFGVMGIQAPQNITCPRCVIEFQCLIRRDGYSSLAQLR